LRCGGQRVPVTATEFTVIAILMRSAGQVVLKEALSERVLGRRLTPFDRSLDTHISNLRRKLGPAKDGSARIKTARGRGYLLVTGSGRVDESS
jgi:two-component system response regulator CpxR